MLRPLLFTLVLCAAVPAFAGPPTCSSDAECDDGNLCNGAETCTPEGGCLAGTAAPDDAPCDDGKSCTEQDTCTAGACSGAALECGDADLATLDFCLETTGCLHCAPAAPRKLSLRFATTTKPGAFRLGAQFHPGIAFDPTGPAGLDIIVHDDAEIVQAAHVPGSAFTSNNNGTVARFVDNTGSVVPGLVNVRVKSGPPLERHKLTAKGPLLVPFAPQITRRFTVRAGGSCATAILGCKSGGGGRSDRCN